MLFLTAFASLLVFDCDSIRVNLNLFIDDKFITYGVVDEKIMLCNGSVNADSIAVTFVPGEVVLSPAQVIKINQFKGSARLKIKYQDPNALQRVSIYILELKKSWITDEFTIFNIYNMYKKMNRKTFFSSSEYVYEFKNQSIEMKLVRRKM